MKKNYYLITLLAFLLAGVYAISISNKDDSNKKLLHAISSADILQNQIDKKLERRKKGYAKKDKPDKYVEYRHSLVSGNGHRAYGKNYKINQLKSAIARRASLKSATVTLPWVERGPGNVGGRTRSIIVDPDDDTHQTWFAGSVSGGIWKTTNAGGSWEIISPDFPNLATVSLAMAPSNSNVIYAGTGEGYYNLDAVRGDGIFKSTDKGQNWTQLASTTARKNFYYINSIAISHSNEDVLWIATNEAVIKSIDGGNTWVISNLEIEKRYQKVVIHPTNENVLWVTRNDKGIYKTEDGGENWFLVNDMVGVGRIEITVSTENPDVLYAMDASSKMYYSNDGGTEWANATESESATEFLGGQGWYNSTLAVNPNDATKGFIGGIDLYSFELGAEIASTGKQAFKINNNISSLLEFNYFGSNHANGGIEFLSSYDDVMQEIQIQFGSGVTQKAHQLIHNSGSEAFSKNIGEDIAKLSYSNYVDVPFKVMNITSGEQLYASFIDGNGNGKFDVYENGYEIILVHENAYSSTANSVISGNDGNSNVMAAIYPKLVPGAIWNEASMPSGNISLKGYELKDRNLSATKISSWSTESTSSTYSHADHHNITIVEKTGDSFDLIVGNDGGVGFSSDGGATWTSKSRGYVTSQFYGITRHPKEYKYFGGLQDNGSVLSGVNPNKMSDWEEVLGGDGFDVVWHPYEVDKIIGCYYNNQLLKSEDGGNRWIDIGQFIGDNASIEGAAPFLTKIASSLVDPDLLFTGGISGLWKSTNFGDSWTNIDMGPHWGYVGGASPKIAISEANPDIVWAGIRMNDNTDYTTGRILVSTNGGDSFTDIDVIRNMGSITNIIAHPTDPETAYVLFSFSDFPKIFRTTDLGKNWEDITGFGINGSSESSNGFPDVAINTMLVMPFNTDIIWAGTEIGLFISNDNGVNWEYSNNGIPAVSIWDIKIVGDEVILGTHGLGVWTVKMAELDNNIKHPYITRAAINPKGNYLININFDTALDSVELYNNAKKIKTLYDVVKGEKMDTIYKESGVTEKVYALAFKDGEQYISNVKHLEVSELMEPQGIYLNDFSKTENLDDFAGNGFSIIYNDIFNFDGINSPHPYPENTDLYYTLKYPIIVNANPSMAFIKYYDIAFLETGESGAVYPHEDFYDYAVLEGTKDGINWVALELGYDFSYNAAWAEGGTTYESLPSVSDFVDHHIDLHDSFEANDTILLRFKLHSDPFTNGWGWVIDNIRIQGQISGVVGNDNVKTETSVFPNPVEGSDITLKIKDSYIGSIEINLFDTSGKQLQKLTYFKGAEVYEQQINLPQLSSGIYFLKIRIGNTEKTEKIKVE